MKAIACTAGVLLILVAPHTLRAQEKNPPNLAIDVSAAAVNAAVARNVDRVDPVEETIQKTPFVGTGRTIGTVSAELVPNAENAVMDVVLRAFSVSKTIGDRPYVCMYTTNETPMEIRCRVVMDGRGIRAHAAPVHATTRITLEGMTSKSHPDCWTLRLAQRMYDQCLPAAEEETAYKTARKAAGQLGDETRQTLAAVSQAVGRALGTFERSGALEYLDKSTTAKALQMRLRVAGAGDGPSGPVPPLPENVDVSLRVHESLVNEMARELLADRSFLLQETKKFYDETTLGLLRDGRNHGGHGLAKLEKLLADVGVPPTTITFATKDPLTVIFGDNDVTLEMHIASIRRPGEGFVGMRVRAGYRFEVSKEGLHVVRTGPIRFLPSDAPPPANVKLEPQPASVVLLREAMFAEIFKERLGFAAPAVPTGLVMPRLQASYTRVRDGWLTLAWKLDKSAN
jgi:hypothetical protein